MLAVNETTLTKNAQVRMDLDKASLVGATHPHRPASAQRMAATGDGNHTAGRSAPTTTNARDLEKLVQYSCGDQRPEYLSAPLVHKAFEAAAAAHPQRRCLCFDGEWVCYSEVNRRATQMAESLAGFGVRPGTVVALFLERSLELVVAMVAVFKAGGCYLPCDPSYPDARLSVYLDDGSAHVVMVDAQHSERVRGMVASGVRIVRVDVEQAGGQGRQIDLVRACAEDPAYMIFTSGSTGRPKGVVVPHAGLRDLLPWLVEQFKLSERGHCMQSCRLLPWHVECRLIGVLLNVCSRR